MPATCSGTQHFVHSCFTHGHCIGLTLHEILLAGRWVLLLDTWPFDHLMNVWVPFCPVPQIVNKGVGERVAAASITWQSIVAGVTQILGDPTYTQRAAAIGASIRAAPAVQEAADRVEAWARSV
jgi:hypothetical protein